MEYEIERNGRGYYTLYINGQFAGNFDTAAEALGEYCAAEEIE